MEDVLVVAVKGLAGGFLVLAFALLSESVEPKRFAGLFGAAPAVAIAGLAVTLVSKGAHDARENSIGMLAGCLGMFCYAAVTVALLKRTRAVAGTAVGIVAWIAPTASAASFLL
jgi:uncharacterized membrane protein (GlpM family)